MARDEFSARNGTLSINLQTRIQRSKIGERFTVDNKVLGVASDNAKSLFGGADGSPIGYANNDQDNGLNNRDDLGDVYTRYAKLAIDPEASEVNGFGFENSNTANMNYSGSLNLFHENGKLKIADGQPYEDDANVKAYRGFPDLVAGDIHYPALAQKTPTPGLSQVPDGSSYGHETEAFRDEIKNQSTLLGRHLENSGDSNGDSETLGKYFTQNYVGSDEQ